MSLDRALAHTRKASILGSTSVQLIAGRVVSAGSTYVGLLLVSAVAGFTTRGYVDILLQVAVVTAILSGIGGPTAMTHFAAIGSLSQHAVRSWFLISSVMTAALAALVATGRTTIGLGQFGWLWVFAAIFTMALATNALAVTLSIAVADGQTRPMLTAQVLSSVCYVLMIGLLLYSRADEPVLIVGLASTYFVGAWHLGKAIRVSQRTTDAPRASSGDFLGYGIRSVFGTIGVAVVLRGDILLLATLVKPNEVGRYTTVLLIMQTTQLIPSALGGKILAELSAEARPPRRRQVLLDFQRLLLLVGTLTVIGLLVSVLLIQITLWPGSELFVLACCFAPGYIIWMSVSVSSADLSARKLPGRASVGFFIGVGTMFAFDLAAVPTFGITAAAIGSTLGYAATAVALLWMRGRADRSNV